MKDTLPTKRQAQWFRKMVRNREAYNLVLLTTRICPDVLWSGVFINLTEEEKKWVIDVTSEAHRE